MSTPPQSFGCRKMCIFPWGPIFGFGLIKRTPFLFWIENFEEVFKNKINHEFTTFRNIFLFKKFRLIPDCIAQQRPQYRWPQNRGDGGRPFGEWPKIWWWAKTPRRAQQVRGINLAVPQMLNYFISIFLLTLTLSGIVHLLKFSVKY